MNDKKRLKLRAADAEDLTVIAACMQDALMDLNEMSYVKEERRFAAVFVRFKHEAAQAGRVHPPYLEQVTAGLHFDRVNAVKFRGLDRSGRSKPLELLTIASERAPQGGVWITLLFAGGGVIGLQADAIACRLQDLGEPWPTTLRPDHRETDEG
ncbi:MAG: DUF2948 family protein [Alphaproteobacteria bacterium]